LTETKSGKFEFFCRINLLKVFTNLPWSCHKDDEEEEEGEEK